jgi:hypothetical protein
LNEIANLFRLAQMAQGEINGLSLAMTPRPPNVRAEIDPAEAARPFSTSGRRHLADRAIVRTARPVDALG